MASSIKVTTGKPISGKNIFYFIQSVHNKIGEAALMPAYRTSGDLTLGGDFIDEQSQQGRILSKGTDEHEVELSQYFVPTDPSINVVREAQRNGDSVKVWRVIVDPAVAKGSGAKKTYPALFGYGKVSELTEPSDIGDLVEVSYTLSVVGSMQSGMFPLTDEDIKILNQIYDYQNPGETTGDYDNIQKTDGTPAESH